MTGSRLMHWIFCSLAAALVVAGCTSDTTTSESTGGVNLNLELAEGVEINEVDWVLTSPGMDPMAGTIDTSAPGATASVEVYGLPPGDDYNIELTATSEDGTVTCGGDADFEVEVGVTTDIMVMLNCKRPERLGGVRVNGKFNICADLAKVIVQPLQTSVGNDIDLFAMAVDAEEDLVKYIWSGTGGLIADPNAQTTTYTCGEAGEQLITIAVTDDDMEYCVDSWSVPVTCVPGDVDLCEGVDCDDGNECTDNLCNPATGACVNDSLPDGTSCDGGAGICDGGECVDINLCDGVDCDDQNECTIDACDPADGSCSNTPVDDGTECNNGDGTCFEGNCMDIGLCDDVVCEPTLNDCTVGICNMDTGVCDETNVPDGTECNGGAGSCSNGECIDDNLCVGVDCTSQNDCIGDGTCDPATGECIPGDNVAQGEACDLLGLGDGFCDGAGTCVECNGPVDCGPAEQCFVATCVDNACGAETAPDGTTCDLVGTGDGVCDAGECVTPPECITAADCPDMVCSSKDCVSGACEYTPTDGASCEVEVGVPGTCSGMTCVGLCVGVDCTSQNECVQDGTCDDQSGECIPGDNQPDGTLCLNGAGTCMMGECMLAGIDPPREEAVITVSCGNNVTADVSILPYLLGVDPDTVSAGQTFTAALDGVAEFSEEFLDAAQGAVPGGVRSAALVDLKATVQTRGDGATGPNVVMTAGSDIPFTCALAPTPCDPANNTSSVPGQIPNTDCVPTGFFNPCNQVVDVPISEDCAPGGECDTLGKASQCASNNFCVTGGLPIDLDANSGTYVAGPSGSIALFGWYDDPADASPGVGTPAIDPDNTWNMLQPQFTGIAGPVGLAVNAGGLSVQLECVMGVDAGLPDVGVGVPDDGSPTPDSELISFEIP